jgi:hypothetical protein
MIQALGQTSKPCIRWFETSFGQECCFFFIILWWHKYIQMVLFSNGLAIKLSLLDKEILWLETQMRDSHSTSYKFESRPLDRLSEFKTFVEFFSPPWQIRISHFTYAVPTVMNTNASTLWDATSCSLVDNY